MARLSDENLSLAAEIISRYPRPRSAIIPLLHLAQEQDGYVTESAMRHVGELVGATSAEILGTCSFYEMFKRHEVGRFLVNVCTNISCQLVGGEELLAAFEDALGITAGETTPDGMFTLEDVECIAACTEAPACQVNYRYFHRLDPADVAQLLADLRDGALDDDVPDHGVLAFVRQHIREDRRGPISSPETAVRPAWFDAREGASS